MNSRERVLAALNLREPDRVPYIELQVDDAFVNHFLGLDTGNRGVGQSLDTVRDCGTEKAFSAALGKDNIISSIRPPFLAEKRTGRDRRVVYGRGLITTKEDVLNIDLADPTDEALYDAVRQMASEKEDFAMCAMTRLGMSNAWIGMGLERFTYALVDDPVFVEAVLDVYASWEEAVIERLCALDIDVLVLVDDICGTAGPFISPPHFRKTILPRVKRVTAKITKPWIYHCCGNVLPIMEDLLGLGMSGLHPIEPSAMDIDAVKKQYGSRVCLIGNIDMPLLVNGTPEEVDTVVKKRIASVAPGGGYMVSSGNSLADYLPIQNVAALAEAVRKYGHYPITNH